MHKLRIFILCMALCPIAACEKEPTAPPEPIPTIVWQETHITPFLTKNQWKSSSDEGNWKILNDALHTTIDLPEALETKLLKTDRGHWKNVLSNIEKYQFERKDALILSNIQITPPCECNPPGSAFSLLQRAQLQLTLQLHRNVLWRMGRLEMASTGISNALKTLLAQFKSGHIKGADKGIIQPIRKMGAQIDTLRQKQIQPQGIWMPGDFHFRAARTAQAAPIFLRALDMLIEWQEQMENSKRWQYLAHSATPTIQAIRAWLDEYKSLIRAFSELTDNIQILERGFAPPHAFVAYPCIEHNLKRMRIISELYNHILPMQWMLTQAAEEAGLVRNRLRSKDYAAVQQEFLSSEVERFILQINTVKAKLTRTEDMLLYAWDITSNVVWGTLKVFTDPIHNHSAPAVESPETWNLLYKELKNELFEIQKNIEPEPEQPLNRRKKHYSPYISDIVESLHSPARIDEVERSLLAISELEAHMLSIRDELMRLCKQGACRSFPEAEIANSPRTNAWIVTWRQSPSNERTLGHSLVVIKLCQLHLSRLVQRLAEIYAWFAETSNADLSWKKLKPWQRIWTLYAEPNGTYATFLKSVAALDQNISKMAQPPQKKACSQTLNRLLQIQDQFFDLTIDYARFLDAKVQPPTSFDDLVSTWETLDATLIDIEKATLERDAAQHPEQVKKQKKKKIDIPR